MTKEEAIEQIKWYFECDDGIAAEDITKQAIDMAIEALKGGDAEMQTIAKTPDYMQHSRHNDGKDLISRADIPYHTQLEPMGNGQYSDVEVAYKTDINALPSADAVQSEECDHCVYKWGMIGGDDE